MRPLHWWLGIAALCGALLLHGFGPRYRITVDRGTLLREDRWLGRIEVTNDARQAPWVTRTTREPTGAFTPADIVPPIP